MYRAAGDSDSLSLLGIFLPKLNGPETATSVRSRLDNSPKGIDTYHPSKRLSTPAEVWYFQHGLSRKWCCRSGRCGSRDEHEHSRPSHGEPECEAKVWNHWTNKAVRLANSRHRTVYVDKSPEWLRKQSLLTIVVLVLTFSCFGKNETRCCDHSTIANSHPGAGFPLAAKKIKWLRIPPRIFFLCKHFGTGVLIATAFVHVSEIFDLKSRNCR